MQIIPEFLGTLCGAIPLEGGLVVGLFLAGAAGSTLHCGPMCGGFVLGQVADRLAVMPAGTMCERRRIGSALLLPYHAGRVLTYAALGAVAGFGGAALSDVPYLAAGLLMLAAGLFVLMACVCMWMMWAMTWMSQVNPVLYPYVTKPLKEL